MTSLDIHIVVSELSLTIEVTLKPKLPVSGEPEGKLFKRLLAYMD